jgi:acyl-CoA synthetase (AMP-forming)/AMP-acid ligase II
MDDAVATLLEHTRARPDAALLLTGGRTYTYADFTGRVYAMVERLRAAGLARGDRVATLLDEYDDFFVAALAIWMAGGCLVPLNTSLPASDVEWLVGKARPALLLVPGGGEERAHGVRALHAAAADLRPAAAPADLRPVTGDEPAMIMFTSGTTGLPKGVCQHLRAISGNASLVAEALRLTAGDRIFINTPPYFTSGVCHFLTLMANGGGVAGRQGFFFGTSLLDEMRELGCTGFGGAPAHLVRVVEPLEEPVTDGGLRFWMSSGDHLPLRTIERTREMLPGVEIFNVYGLTEVSGRLCILRPDELDLRVGSVGRPFGDMTVTVRDPEGGEVPPGESGELYVTGSLVMQGYLDEPGITAAALTPLGFRTGDFGHADADGYVWVEGRKDDIIKRGGEKVSTVHIQQALMATGLVADAAVVAADDEILGHVPVAFVVPSSADGYDRRALMRALKAALPATSLPSKVVPLDEIPRTGSGKAIRAELLARLEGGAE